MATINGDGGDNALTGGSGNDILNGLAGNDTLTALGGSDKLDGGTGNDVLNAGQSDGAIDTLIGGSGDDVLFGCETDQLDGGVGFDAFTLLLTDTIKALNLNLTGLTKAGGHLDLADGTHVTGFEAGALYLGLGNDKVKVGDAVVSVFGGFGDDNLTGGKGDDILGPGQGNDTVNGGKGSDWVVYADGSQGVHVNLSIQTAQNTVGAGTDTIKAVENVVGSAFADTLIGSKVANQIEGSLGADTMTGGAGADHFVFTSYADSMLHASDHITDLEAADVIDLSGIDAVSSTTTVNEAFTLVAHFTHHAGEATFSYDGHNTLLDLDVTGDGVADTEIIIDGDHHTFSNFVL